jgi:hypothetical protein
MRIPPLVANLTSIRLLLLLATSDLEVEQIDVKTTFLHGDLKEEGFVVEGK